MISVVILTHNEEKDLPACLQSVAWSSDVHVLDSGSTDKTIEIAKQFNANISANRFESFGKQRNFALDTLELKNEWILFLDADENVSEQFHAEITEAVESADANVAGFYCCWKMILNGRWLKYCDNFPKWQFRLMRRGRARFTDFGHGQKEHEVKGLIKYIKEPYLHYGFSKGWSHWVERHNRYSTLEASDRHSNLQPLENIFSRHGSIRNPALKFWLTKFAAWPVLRFLYTYVLRLGFLEGSSGLIYCVNMAYYEFLIQIKMRETQYKLTLYEKREG